MQYIDLKKLRADNGGITQSQLADLLGCKQPFIAQVETGVRSLGDDMLKILEDKFGDISAYITDFPEKPIVQNNRHGDNIGGDKILYSSEDKDAEIIRLTAKLEAAESEIAWLRSMVEKLSAK